MTAPVPIEAALESLYRQLDGPPLVAQSHCVDGLLDCWNAATSDLVRHLVADLLSDIRHLTAVRASALRDRLAEISAALAVELAFSQTAQTAQTVPAVSA